MKRTSRTVVRKNKRPPQDETPTITECSADMQTAPKPQNQIGDNDRDDEIALTAKEKEYLRAVHALRQRLKSGIASAVKEKKDVSGISFQDAVKAADLAHTQGLQKEMLEKLNSTYQGRQASTVMSDTRHVRAPRSLQRNLLRRLGIGKGVRLVISAKSTGVNPGGGRTRALRYVRIEGKVSPSLNKNVVKRAVDLSRRFETVALGESLPVTAGEDEPLNSSQTKDSKRPIPKLDQSSIHTLRESDVAMEPLMLDTPAVPGLSFDLSRVLFNPGVYQLQDPRSRVFNFSPYLQRILPVTEFNFDVLNEYITTSRDSSLRDLGLKHRKKYLGSSSSMTGVLSHFHFLLSAWRPVEVKTLSQSFTDPLRSFTQFQRGPSAIFLRWKDGIYAVDADKEHDSANILMSLGKSMEKLFTLPEEEFERYRRTVPEQAAEPPRPEPEAYHYTESGDFLLRSQLDAYDPRLPGTGMFDLKTRAVVTIRMNVRRPEDGLGYEIQNRFGNMESYEREYFDMIRSAFLKYSLQVRMGRMDGIFVAYHNIERIFGFQYVSLSEMDFHLHGTEDRRVGDLEFRLSVGLLNRIFDRVTEKMPDTSLRFHFETRDSTGSEGSFMYIFAEAQSEEDVENIQNSKKAEIAEFEARILNTSQPAEGTVELAVDTEQIVGKTLDSDPGSISSDDLSEELHLDEGSEAAEGQSPSELKADVVAKSGTFSQPPADKLMGLMLKARNRVNGQLELRPVNLHQSDSWELEYTLEELPHERALFLYSQCRARRAKLQKASQREDVAADYYLRKMKRLAQNGRHIRKNMDKADAGRPVVVLDRVQ